MQTYEIELRALITEEKYNELLKHFDLLATRELDDAETYTFLSKEYNIKVKNLISKGKAKITAKKGAEYKQQADERELSIDPKDIDKAVAFITLLGFNKHIPSLQKRINYTINGITISVKHETNWGYHIEAEIVVNKQQDVENARERLYAFFKELEIVPLTEKETQDLINSVLQKYNMKSI